MKNSFNLMRDENGAVFMIVAAALPPLIILTSLILDLGYTVVVRRDMQHAADAAAYAAATLIPIYESSGTYKTNDPVFISLIANQVTASIATTYKDATLVPTISPAPSLDTTSLPYTITVNLSETLNGLFLGAARNIAGLSDTGNAITIRVTAKARAKASEKPICWLALSPTASGAFSLNGSVIIGTISDLDPCGISVNSDSATSVSSSGTAVDITVPVTSAGGYSVSGNPPPMKSSYSYPVSDPYLQNGAQSYIQSLSNSVFGANGQTKANKSTVLSQSTAVNGSHYSNFDTSSKNWDNSTSPPTLWLPSGTYYVDDIRIAAGVTIKTIAGAHATIIVNPTGTISMTGGSSIGINAPITGPLTGISVTGMGSYGNGSNGAASLTGNSAFSGAIYLPNSGIDLQGTFQSRCMQIIADHISVGGNPTVGFDCPVGTPVVHRYLIGLTQ